MMQSNAILACLSEGDLAALRPHLKATHLEQKTVLFEAGDTIKAVYFPISAVDFSRWSRSQQANRPRPQWWARMAQLASHPRWMEKLR